VAVVKIHHSGSGTGFTRIPNETLQDERLSWAARGHLAYLLSRPPDWATNADAESRRARSLRDKYGEGRRAMRAVYDELRKAGYLHQVKVPAARGRWKTETHLYDRPHTGIPLTGRPETGTSVPPAQTPEPVDNQPENDAEFPQVSEFPQVAPRYRSPGVGQPARRPTGTSVSGTSLQTTEDRVTEDKAAEADGLCGGVVDPIDDKEQPSTNPQAGSHWPGDDGPDAQQIPRRDSESPATPPVRARENGHWRSPQQIAAEQAAESRAGRQAAEAAS
jgi:hypothetical protein